MLSENESVVKYTGYDVARLEITLLSIKGTPQSAHPAGGVHMIARSFAS